MRTRIICHMISSLDGGLHLSRCSRSPDGDRTAWHRIYEEVHQSLGGDGWIIGRVTMAEMSRATAHPPASWESVDRRQHIGSRTAGSYAVALDRSGKLHFDGPEIGGDHVVVILGPGVPDSHLAELAQDGVSYLVSESDEIDLEAMLARLGQEFGIRTLLLEGGASICGSFFAAGLVDELSLLVAPVLDGRAGHECFIEFGQQGLADKTQLSLKDCKVLGSGLVHLRYTIVPR